MSSLTRRKRGKRSAMPLAGSTSPSAAMWHGEMDRSAAMTSHTCTLAFERQSAAHTRDRLHGFTAGECLTHPTAHMKATDPSQLQHLSLSSAPAKWQSNHMCSRHITHTHVWKPPERPAACLHVPVTSHWISLSYLAWLKPHVWSIGSAFVALGHTVVPATRTDQINGLAFVGRGDWHVLGFERAEAWRQETGNGRA